MWEEIKSKKENAILCLEYNDFAFVEVEKIEKESINFLSVELEIYDIYHNSFMLYKMDEVSKLLNIFKTKDDTTRKNNRRHNNNKHSYQNRKHTFFLLFLFSVIYVFFAIFILC